MAQRAKLLLLVLSAGTMLSACARHSQTKTTDASTWVVADGHDEQEDVAYLRTRVTALRAKLHVAIAVIRGHNSAQRTDYYVLLAASANGLPQSGPAQ
jgi:hypothetical protein